MSKYPKKSDIQLWIPAALSIFQAIMPPIEPPYPKVLVVDGRNFRKTRLTLIDELECPNRNFPEPSIMEYIHGRQGCAILIRQNLLPDAIEGRFHQFLWHELGHFYAINAETDGLYRYNQPGLVDDSLTVAFTDADVLVPILGWSDERKKQEGYWFWQEFIAEALSNHVASKYLSVHRSYRRETIEWHPDYWGAFPQRLTNLLEGAVFNYYSTTIDEYGLARYFAYLLTDDLVLLYREAAETGKLKVYNNGRIIIPDKNIEPTCISDLENARLCEPLWDLKGLLEKQMANEQFWLIDENRLREIGDCIGRLTLGKIILLRDVMENEE